MLGTSPLSSCFRSGELSNLRAYLVRGVLGGRKPMNPLPPGMPLVEQRRWHGARSVQDLANLVACWLEGTISSQPGYQPQCGPDPETTPLIKALTACNRAGYLTFTSQPGLDDGDFQQRAAVEGIIADPQLLQRLTGLAHSAGLHTAVHTVQAPGPHASGFTVTTVDDQPVTTFGRPLDTWDIDGSWSGCHPNALAALTAAHQVTLVDPDVGRTDRLLDVLGQAARPTAADGPNDR